MKDEKTTTINQPKELVIKPNEMIDPAVQTEFAVKAAKSLTALIKGGKIKPVNISGHEYLKFEHWQTLARFFNTSVGTEKTEEIMRDGKLHGYKATAIVYNQNGIKIGSAEASCMRDEKNWRSQIDNDGYDVKPEFQLKSMAQTRACAKALRNVFAWVAVLGGYDATPAEEMDGVKINNHNNTGRSAKLATEKQIKFIENLCAKLGQNVSDLEIKFNKSRNKWTASEASKLITKLSEKVEQARKYQVDTVPVILEDN